MEGPFPIYPYGQKVLIQFGARKFIETKNEDYAPAYECAKAGKSHKENHEGKIRKYYKITTMGRQTLEKAKEKITILINEIMT